MLIVLKEKDISWWQIDCKVFLQVRIPHVSQKNSDILTSNKYLKVCAMVLIIYYLPIIFLLFRYI